MKNIRWIPLCVGFGLCVVMLVLPRPEGLSVEGQRALAVTLLMAAWWMGEALPMATVALVPLLVYPVLGVMGVSQTARQYVEPNIFLFMGGFMIAMAMQKWNLHRRIALYVIAAMGTGQRRMLLGFMSATAFLSMWVSNTATAVMMLPIALAVLHALADAAHSQSQNQSKSNFGTMLMLGIAYASSIGGVATLIGSPPNLIFAGQARALFPGEPPVTFLRWFMIGFPLALGFLLISWGYLASRLTRPSAENAGSDAVVKEEIQKLGPWTRGEIGVMVVFAAAALGWIARPYLAKGIHDAAIAMTAAAVLFVTPVDLKKREFLLDWRWASRIPWGVLLLFGGGFALAESFTATGLAHWISRYFEVLHGMPLWLMILILTLLATFLSELMSNTAQVTMLIPVLAAAAPALEVHPYWLMLPVTFASSFAFMMPVGTPPNAIAIGTGYVRLPDMAKAGFVLNLLGSLWITFLSLILLPFFI